MLNITRLYINNKGYADCREAWRSKSMEVRESLIEEVKK